MGVYLQAEHLQQVQDMVHTSQGLSVKDDATPRDISVKISQHIKERRISMTEVPQEPWLETQCVSKVRRSTLVSDPRKYGPSDRL